MASASTVEYHESRSGLNAWVITPYGDILGTWSPRLGAVYIPEAKDHEAERDEHYGDWIKRMRLHHPRAMQDIDQRFSR